MYRMEAEFCTKMFIVFHQKFAEVQEILMKIAVKVIIPFGILNNLLKFCKKYFLESLKNAFQKVDHLSVPSDHKNNVSVRSDFDAA